MRRAARAASRATTAGTAHPCDDGLTGCAAPHNLPRMSFLLPQERTGVVQASRAVDLHGDRWFDLLVTFDGDTEARTLRIGAADCPAGLTTGDRVTVRFVMGVATAVRRA